MVWGKIQQPFSWYGCQQNLISLQDHFEHFILELAKLVEPPPPSVHEKCAYSKLFWSAFSRIRAEYGPE